MLNFPSSSRTIREIINRVKRKEGASVFTKKLEESKFETPENWSYGWLKTKEASIFIKNSKGLFHTII
jgi:hypothetical protein